MKKTTTYYLSSLESARFEPVRECELIKQMAFDTGKQCALVRLTPAVNGEPWGLINNIEYFVLAPRHEGEKLFPIAEFPCFVHIARLRTDQLMTRDVIIASDLENVAWGELYRSRSDAENHSFGNTSHANKMQELNPPGVSFVRQQDGPIEKQFTSQVAAFLKASSATATAYLCRVHYGNRDQVSVAVCIASPDGQQMELVNGISVIFQKMFGRHEHVDIIFLDEEQQSSISEVCRPFCECSD